MGKLPFMQFYPADWTQDTRCLSPVAKAAWIDILMTLWLSEQRGELSLPLEGWAGVTGQTVPQVEAAIAELESMKVADVGVGPASVLIKSRRMVREEKARRQWREQKARKRVRPMSGECPGNVPGIYQKSEVRSHKKKEIKEGEGIASSAKPPRPPRCVLPEDFEPNDKNRELAKALGLNCGIEFLTFKAHCHAEGTTFVDWQAAYEKWIRKSKAWQREHTQ